jgi:hypothetical protein
MHTPTFDELFGPALDRIAAQISKPWPAAFATLDLESIPAVHDLRRPTRRGPVRRAATASKT